MTMEERTWLMAETVDMPSRESESISVASASRILFASILVGATLLVAAATPWSSQFSMKPPFLGSSHSPCGKLSAVSFADMHDGDQKVISIHNDQMIIQSANDKENWMVTAQLDPSTCTAMVNFDVPGKPSPPPVPLLLTVWTMERPSHHRHHKHASISASKLTMEFTDPSETIAPKDMPLNHWVQL